MQLQVGTIYMYVIYKNTANVYNDTQYVYVYMDWNEVYWPNSLVSHHNETLEKATPVYYIHKYIHKHSLHRGVVT